MAPRPDTVQSIVMRGYGPPEVLGVEDVAPAPPGPHDVRIRTIAAAVNHTDLRIRAGDWPVGKPDPFPYTPGVEAVGVVAEVGSAVSRWVPGQTVITMMQGLGGVRAERPGGYAGSVTVDAGALAAIPPSVDPFAMAALGLAGVTAHEGLRRLGPLQGRRVLVTGAAGGVGSAAIAIARAQGAAPVGVITRPDQADYVRALGAVEVVVADRQSPRLAVGPVDGVLDMVGGALFGACVNSLRAGGVLSLVGAVGEGDVTFDPWQLIRPVVLTGYSTESLQGADLRQAVGALSGWLSSGAIRAPACRRFRLEEAAAAHRLLEGGGVQGRILLVPPGAG